MNGKIRMLREALEQNSEEMEKFKTEPPRSAEELLALAARLGVDLSGEDLNAARTELNDEELDMVAGGISKKDMKEVCGDFAYFMCVAAVGQAVWIPGEK